MILHIDVVNKIATYQTRDGCIVCGNNDYQIQFTFDDEWEGVEKEAYFIWPGNVKKADIGADGICNAPVITNTSKVRVGVCAKDESKTTTSTTIRCHRSIRCE